MAKRAVWLALHCISFWKRFKTLFDRWNIFSIIWYHKKGSIVVQNWGWPQSDDLLWWVLTNDATRTHAALAHLLIRLSLIPRWIDPAIFPSKMCNIGPFQSTDRQSIQLHPSFLRADSHQYCFKPIYQVPNYYHHFYCAVNAIWPHFEIYARLASRPYNST